MDRLLCSYYMRPIGDDDECDCAKTHERELLEMLADAILAEWEGDEATAYLRRVHGIGELDLKRMVYGNDRGTVKQPDADSTE